MRVIRIMCLVWMVGLLFTRVSYREAQAAPIFGFNTTPSFGSSHNLESFTFGFSFLTNATIDDLVSFSVYAGAVDAYPMQANLYSSDATGNGISFIATLGSANSVNGVGWVTFTPPAPIVLQPNTYYWIQLERASNLIIMYTDFNAMPNGYYTYVKSRFIAYSDPPPYDFQDSSLRLNVQLVVDPHEALSASAICVGDDLAVTISAGDGNFDIASDSGALRTDVASGTTIIDGPIIADNLTITETTGDTQNINVGDFDCFVSEALSASAICIGDNLQVVIGNGNAPFNLSVNGSLIQNGVGVGIYYVPGPATFGNITITEIGGDYQTLVLPDVACPPAQIARDMPAVGCEFVDDVALQNMTDNTYCRVLMRDGAVTGYSGAVPRNLIDLGVIFAVDVYRLDGGRSITEFPDYTRVCLAGQGRLFYLDARTSPRVQVELATETDGAFTCGWIPAAGTLILTSS